MSCPICGANCKCKKRGPGGICCSCHRHKVRRLLIETPKDDATSEAIEQHREWMRETLEAAGAEQLDLGIKGAA